MATYRAIASTETDPGSPVTSTLIEALDDNTTAIAEGADGAPRIMGRAIDWYIGDLTIGGTAVTEFTGLDGVTCVRLEGYWTTSTVLQVAFSTNDGASYGAWYSMGAGASVYMVSLTSNRAFAVGVSSAATSTPSGVNAIRFRGVDGTSDADFIVTSYGTMD